MLKPLRPIFFVIDNDRDKCIFCGAKGKLIKSMKTGKNLCEKCIEYLAEALVDESVILDEYKIKEPLRLTHSDELP